LRKAGCILAAMFGELNEKRRRPRLRGSIEHREQRLLGHFKFSQVDAGSNHVQAGHALSAEITISGRTCL
jgi:hypothetical protein